MHLSRSTLSALALLTLAACIAAWFLRPTFSALLGVPTPSALETRVNAALHTLAPPVPSSQRLEADPGSRDGYVQLARQDAAAAGIPPELFVKQINRESGFDPRCNDPGYTPCISPAGAEGIAQFEPETARGLGVNPWDPVDALWGAAQLMARYNHIYGDYRKALASYNGGSGNLQEAMNVCGAQWLNCEPEETQQYVQAIDP